MADNKTLWTWGNQQKYHEELMQEIEDNSTGASTPVLNTSTGNPITITDGADAPLIELGVYGNSVQNGTPTPDAPIDIVSVGDDGDVGITACGKNLFNVAVATKQYVSSAGTNENDPNYLLSEYIPCQNANYITVSGIVGSETVWYRISKYDKNKTFIIRLVEANVQTGAYTFDVSDCSFFRLSYENAPETNAVATDVQVEYGATATEFEQYKGYTATITSGLPLCSVGNVRDELIYNADGTGKIIKRTAKLDSYNGEAITTDYISSTGGLDTGAEVVYVLENPIEIELSADKMAELMQLQTFNVVTNVYNNENADLYIKYWCDNNINTLLNSKAPLIHTHTVSDIVDFPETPDTSNLVSKSGDAMEGILIAQSNTDYTIAQVRNVTMSTGAASGGSNGQIHYQYE